MESGAVVLLAQFNSTVIQDGTGPQGNAGFKQFIPRT
jgi:hypothetical protein